MDNDNAQPDYAHYSCEEKLFVVRGELLHLVDKIRNSAMYVKVHLELEPEKLSNENVIEQMQSILEMCDSVDEVRRKVMY